MGDSQFWLCLSVSRRRKNAFSALQMGQAPGERAGAYKVESMHIKKLALNAEMEQVLAESKRTKLCLQVASEKDDVSPVFFPNSWTGRAETYYKWRGISELK